MTNQPKYTRDQKRRAVEECVKRLNEFEATLRLIRQFDIGEQDILEYTSARYVNGSKYTMSYDPATPAYDPYNGQAIGQWTAEARVKPSRSLRELVTTPSAAPSAVLRTYMDWS